LGQGVSWFIDLTESGEYGLSSYVDELNEEASKARVTINYQRFPIPDMSAPTTEEMHHILKTLKDALKTDQVIYLHCYGGKGRTGTVVGCFLVEQGFTGEEALLRIETLRGEELVKDGPSPETEAQRAMVINWRK
jgi:protein-tyrosine phosphatase